MPVARGSTTPLANAAATAASTALPPACKISRPASAAGGCLAVTMPWLAIASSTTMWRREVSDVINSGKDRVLRGNEEPGQRRVGDGHLSDGLAGTSRDRRRAGAGGVRRGHRRLYARRG